MTTSRADRAFKLAALSQPSPTIKLAIAPQGVGELLRRRMGFPSLRSFDLPGRWGQNELARTPLSRASANRTLGTDLTSRIRDVEDALLEFEGVGRIPLSKGQTPAYGRSVVPNADPGEIFLTDYNPMTLAHEGRHGVQFHDPRSIPERLSMRDADNPSNSRITRRLAELAMERDANTFALQFARTPDEIADIAAGHGSYAMTNLRSLPHTLLNEGETAVSEILRGRDPRRGIPLDTLRERALRPLIDPTYWQGRINGGVRRAQHLPAHEAISQSILEDLGSGPATAYDDVVREALRKVAPQFKW